MAKRIDPAERYIESKKILPDGNTQYKFSTGGIVIIPPLPESQAWRDRVAREMSNISYKIIRRKIAEKTTGSQN